jgi:proteasome lid subunit RPN8/RPN11
MEGALTRAGLEEVPGSTQALECLLLYMEKAWPEEGCGALFVSAAGEWIWQPIPNVAERPREAFAFGEEWLFLLRQEESRQSRLACLVHSHPGGEACLSKGDTESMAPGGRMLWPQTMQMVVAVEEEGWRKLSWYKPKGAGFECLGRLSRRCFEARKKEKFVL